MVCGFLMIRRSREKLTPGKQRILSSSMSSSPPPAAVAFPFPLLPVVVLAPEEEARVAPDVESSPVVEAPLYEPRWR